MSQDKKQLSNVFIDTDGTLKVITKNLHYVPSVFLIDGVRDLRLIKGDLNFVYKTTPQG